MTYNKTRGGKTTNSSKVSRVRTSKDTMPKISGRIRGGEVSKSAKPPTLPPLRGDKKK